jgi:hypothetical protein
LDRGSSRGSSRGSGRGSGSGRGLGSRMGGVTLDTRVSPQRPGLSASGPRDGAVALAEGRRNAACTNIGTGTTNWGRSTIPSHIFKPVNWAPNWLAFNLRLMGSQAHHRSHRLAAGAVQFICPSLSQPRLAVRSNRNHAENNGCWPLDDTSEATANANPDRRSLSWV